MKKLLLVIAAVLLLILTACTAQFAAPTGEDGADGSQSEGITMLDEGVWSVNDYTEGLPIPPGTVEWAMLDAQHKNYSVSITDITEDDYDAYRKLLTQEGFSVMENAAEEIAGQDYVSIGTLLSNGEKALSISYTPSHLTMYIALEA